MKKKILSLFLAVILIFSLIPTAVFAVDTNGKVHVIVENTTFTPESDDWDDSFWYGTLVDTWVNIDESSTMMGCVISALNEGNHTQKGAENNYIQEIDGLGEFDGGFMSGWMGTLNDWFTNEGFGGFTVANGKLEAGDEVRILYTCSYGDDLGGSWSNSDTTVKSVKFNSGTLSPAFDKDTHTYTLSVPEDVSSVVVTPTASNKNYQVRTKVGDTVYKRTANVPVANGTEIVVECNYPGSVSMNSGGEHQVYTFNVKKAAPQPQDVSSVLNEAMAKLATSVNTPVFGSVGGEWSVVCLARGGYFDLSNSYFTDYYNRIVDTVNETAASVNAGGALHSSKSTENARLIIALSSIGKTSEKVGDWNLIAPFNDFKWVKKVGINGPVFALIALDTHNYQTTDSTIRKQCIDYILSNQTADGGWSYSGPSASADPDMTSMALQALAPYKDDSDVSAAVERGINALSTIQKDNGGYASWGSVNSESISQVITACAALGINPDTDPRFVKNGKSAVDALLTFYNNDTKDFKHIASGTGNAMATDQAIYALVAYNRLLNKENSLYDMTDVKFSNSVDLTATLGLPREISNKKGTTFNAVVNIDGWKNTEGYKLMDAIVNVPDGLTVKNVKMSNRVSGGQLNYNLESSTGKLRIVYFDPENNSSITLSGNDFPAEFFTIEFETSKKITENELAVAISGMSMKFNSDSESESSMKVVNIDKAHGSISIKKELSFSAAVLYRGDGVDLIPDSKMAVCVSVVNLEEQSSIVFNNGTYNYTLEYSDEITKKTGVKSYVALVDSSVAVGDFSKNTNYTVDTSSTGAEIKFGDTNSDNVINAQDALNSVNYWLRKTDAPNDEKILRTNVNSDSRINTFDALGIVEHFVKGSEYIIVNKAAMVASSTN